MLSINLASTLPKSATILCIGAHSDDIEIGCAGTLLQLLRDRPDVHVNWVVLSANGRREEEAKSSAEEMLSGNDEN